MKQNNLTVRGKLLKARFELPQFDKICVNYLGFTGARNMTARSDGYVYGLGPKSNVVYFKEIDATNTALEIFHEGAIIVRFFYETIPYSENSQ